MEEVYLNGLQGQESNLKFMMDNINIIINMDLVNLSSVQEIFMKDNGNKGKDMAKV